VLGCIASRRTGPPCRPSAWDDAAYLTGGAVVVGIGVAARQQRHPQGPKDVVGGEAQCGARFLPGHLLFGAHFTATSVIGFIALAGIMVRNSVLLIDFVNPSLSQGKPLQEAVIEAGAVRFRPILLTAGTVVVGAVVILFDPIFQGLAIALMMGTIASTVLTLVVVPLVHFMVEKRHRPESRRPVSS